MRVIRGLARLRLCASLRALRACAAGVALIAAAAIAAPAQTGAPRRPVAPVFEEILPALQRATRVPIRLPSQLPDIGQAGDRVYAKLTKATATHYEIVLGLTPTCAGETPCRVATFTGVLTPARFLPPGKRVVLPRQLTGSFTEAPIGANVGDAVLTWREREARYSVAVKAGSYDEVLKLATLTITSRPD
jgi:hypothetical protein